MNSRTTLSLFVVLIGFSFVPSLFHKGMFLDGITYASISRNMSLGLGDFWKPFYTEVIGPEFYAHPPLAFYLQSIFYKLLGDLFFVERLYCLIIFVITAFLIKDLWKQGLNDIGYKKFDLLPVLIWLTIPIVSWSYSNNILENTLLVFDMIAVYLIIQSIQNKKPLLSLLAGASIFLAFLCKGPAGLFPIVIPILYLLTGSNYTIWKSQFYLLLSFILIYAGTICLFNDAGVFFNNYYKVQLAPSIFYDSTATVSNRFDIIWKLILELSIPILSLVLLLYYRYKISARWSSPLNKESLLFIIIGLVASIPLILSLKQRSFYLLPSTPFFSIGIGLLIVPMVKNIFDKIPDRISRRLSYILLFCSATLIFITTFSYGHIKRDAAYIHDVNKLKKIIGNQQIIGSRGAVCEDWVLHAYLSRMAKVSLDCNSSNGTIIVLSDEMDDVGLDGYDLYPLTKFTLLKERVQ